MTVLPHNNKDKRAGFPRRKISCDTCGEFFEAAAERGAAGEGQVRTKAQKAGWALVKGKDYCDNCEAMRKLEADLASNCAPANPAPEPEPKKEAPVLNVSSLPAIPAPTREQKRQIVSILEDVYDTDKGRYKGAETDKTVADLIEGCRLGWVAQLREEFFGPIAGNEEIEKIAADLATLKRETEAQIKRCQTQLDNAERAIKKLKGDFETLDALEKRVRVFRDSFGPKAEALVK